MDRQAFLSALPYLYPVATGGGGSWPPQATRGRKELQLRDQLLSIETTTATTSDNHQDHKIQTTTPIYFGRNIRDDKEPTTSGGSSSSPSDGDDASSSSFHPSMCSLDLAFFYSPSAPSKSTADQDSKSNHKHKAAMTSVSTPEKRTSSSSPETETALFLKVDGDAIYQVQLQRLTRVHLQVEDEIAEYSTSPKPANLSLDMRTATMEGGDCAVVRFRIFCLQCADDTAEQFLALQSVERALQQVVEENQRQQQQQQQQQQLYPSSHYYGAPISSSSVVTTNSLMYAPFPCNELAVPSPSALLRDSCSSTEELGQHEQDLNLASSNDNNDYGDTGGGGNSNSSSSSEQQRLLALLKRRQTARAAAVQKVQGVATLVNFVSTASSMSALLQEEEEKEKEGDASTSNNGNASAKTKLRQQTSTLLSGIATDMHMSYCSHAQLCEAAHTLDTKLSEQESRLEAQLLGFFPQRNAKKRARQHGGAAPETSASAGNDNNTTTAAWTEADKEEQIASMKRLLKERKTTLRARHSLALNSCRG